ncbi:MAG: alkaline phosphatase family protein [Pseudomonadota bacterium]
MSNNHAFDHVIIIMFENMYRSYIMENDYFRSLAEQGIDMQNYFGVMHPSQTNYISSIAAELCNVTDDYQPSPLPQQTIVDLLEDKGVSWKAYMDGYNPIPWSADMTIADQYPYVIKHNPFSSFANIIDNPERWAKIDNQIGFYQDVANGTLPNYSWFTPDMWNDGHYLVGTKSDPAERAPALVDQQANWLKYFFGNLQFPGPNSILPQNTMVVVTWDESDFEADWDKGKKYTYDGPNQIYTVLLGDQITRGKQVEGYNHYSLTRTIEKNFGLDSLGKNDTHSNWFQFLNGNQFSWSEMNQPAGLPGEIESLALAYDQDDLYAACGTKQGIEIWQNAEDQWTCVSRLENASISGVGLESTVAGESLEIFYADQSGIYGCLLGDLSNPIQLVTGNVNRFSVHSAWDGYATMLAWAEADGKLMSLCKLNQDEQAWPAEPVSVGKTTSGDFCLASIGPSVYLIYTRPGDEPLQVLSYNLADFNTVQYPESKWSGCYDDTVANAWNPSSFPVAHFSHMASPVTPGEEEPLTEAYQGSGPLAAASLDGVIHLTHQDHAASEIVTETFSIAGLMTPRLPVSYNASDATTTSNGYGGLAEAGWSEQKIICGSDMRLNWSAMASNSEIICLLYESKEHGMQMIRGHYIHD